MMPEELAVDRGRDQSPVKSSVSAGNVRKFCGFKCASMPASLKYGASASLEIDLPENALVANWTGPSSNGESAIAAATNAVQTPLDFPQLKQATVPGDHVVLALEPGVPQAAAVVAAIIPALLSGGVVAEDITVVRTHADVDADQIDPRSAFPDEQRNAVQLAVHESGDEDQLAFLAADPKGEAIYLNRQMCEADLVIPIGYLRPTSAPIAAAATGFGTAMSIPPSAIGKPSIIFRPMECRSLPASSRTARNKSIKWLGCWGCRLLPRLCPAPAIAHGECCSALLPPYFHKVGRCAVPRGKWMPRGRRISSSPESAAAQRSKHGPTSATH